MEIKAPAKINLFLNVGNKRQDSFHEIISVMVKVNLWDSIKIEESDKITAEGPMWLQMEDNIAYKAALMLKDHAGTDKGCSIKILKNIPAQRGLGGGSSDCAAVLSSLNKLWEINFKTEELGKIGEQLGSDVNFFLYPGDCVVTGRGETVIPFGNMFGQEKNIIIIDTGINMPTKEVYGEYNGGKLTEKEELNRIINYYKEGRWEKILSNDLEEPVFKKFPVLKDLKNRLKNWGAYPLLSGSGSCLFALVEDKNMAESICRILKENFQYKTWIVNNLVY